MPAISQQSRILARALGLLVPRFVLLGLMLCTPLLVSPKALADRTSADSKATEMDSESHPADSKRRNDEEYLGFADPAEGGWHHGEPFKYEVGLLNYLKFPRDKLADHGVDVYLSGLGIGQFIVEGGIEERNRGTFSYDLQVYLDSDKLGLWKGAYGLLRLEGKVGEAGVNPYTGALVPINFDAMVPIPENTGIEATEWWIAQELFGSKAEALFGMWDIGRFFDLVPFSGPYPYRFLNAHMFFNSVLLPYAPYNILGGIVTLKPAEWLTITTGVGDPNSSADDVRWWDEGEVELLHEWRFMARPLGRPGLFTAGFAYKTINDSETHDSDWAVYLNFNQWLYQNPDNPEQAIGLFGRIGITDGEVNAVQNHFSAGLSFDGMIPSRKKDVIGISGWYNNLANHLPTGFGASSAGLESYYRFQVLPWLQVSPDVQYLIKTALPKSDDDTLILGIRALILF